MLIFVLCFSCHIAKLIQKRGYEMSLKVRINKTADVKLVGVVNDGRIYKSTKDTSAFLLKSCHAINMRPHEFKQNTLHDTLVLVQNLFDNKEINYAAYIVLCACVNSVSRESKTVRFKRSKNVDVWNFAALINSAKEQVRVNTNGTYSK